MRLWWLFFMCSIVMFASGCANNWHTPSSKEQQQAQQAHIIGMMMDPSACREAIKRDPDNADAHMCIAEDSIGHNNVAAVKELREVVRIRPNDRKAQFLLAQTLVKLGQTEEAYKLYLQLINQNDLWGKSAYRNLQRLPKP